MSVAINGGALPADEWELVLAPRASMRDVP